jgi:hypothetical protein
MSATTDMQTAKDSAGAHSLPRLVSTFRCEYVPWPKAGIQITLKCGAVRCGMFGGTMPTPVKWIWDDGFWQVRIWRMAIAFRANAERSHAGPLASNCNRDVLPALADATGWPPSRWSYWVSCYR